MRLEELFEIANLDQEDHGIEDVIIWVGMTTGQHGLRVKISNVQGHFLPDKATHFTLTIPDYHIRDGQPAKWLKPKMEDIIDWLKLNQALITAYENGKIQSTREFLKDLEKLP
jgi:hypothetical protein